MFKLLIIVNSGENTTMYLFDDLSLDKFHYYLTANNKCLGSDDDSVLEEINEKLVDSIIITNPQDYRIFNLSGIILLNLAL